MIVVLKQGLLRPKFLYQNFSPSPILSCTITEKLKRVLVAQKSLKVVKPVRVLSDSALFRSMREKSANTKFSSGLYFPVFGPEKFFHAVGFSVVGFFRFLSYRVLFEFWVIGFSKASSVIDSPFGSSVLFFRYAGTFLSKGVITFFY